MGKPYKHLSLADHMRVAREIRNLKRRFQKLTIFVEHKEGTSRPCSKGMHEANHQLDQAINLLDNRLLEMFPEAKDEYRRLYYGSEEHAEEESPFEQEVAEMTAPLRYGAIHPRRSRTRR